LRKGNLKRLLPDDEESGGGLSREVHLLKYDNEKYVLRRCRDLKTAKSYEKLSKDFENWKIFPKFLGRSGKDVLFEAKKSLNDFCHKRYETIYLHLKLRDPLTAKYSSEFEKMNFFFSGIMPGSNNSDELVLQYLNNYIVDYEKVKINSDFGNELKEYIKSQDPQTKNTFLGKCKND